jgi:hypothetical protein
VEDRALNKIELHRKEMGGKTVALDVGGNVDKVH